MINLDNLFGNGVNTTPQTGKPEERDFVPDSIPVPSPVKK